MPGSATCSTSCPAGGYCPNTTTAIRCPAGTYNSLTGQTAATACTPCAAGTYSSTLRASSATTCINCTPGNYCPNAGTTSQAPCAAGYYCSTDTLTRTACPAGTYSASSGATDISTCVACPAATPTSFPASTSQSSCFYCPPGKYCTSSTSTTNCPAGTYNSLPGQTSSTACLPCTVKLWNRNIAGGPIYDDGVYCPPGSTTNQNVCPPKYLCPANGAWAIACVNPSSTNRTVVNPLVGCVTSNDAGNYIGENGEYNAVNSLPMHVFAPPYNTGSPPVVYLQTPTLPAI